MITIIITLILIGLFLYVLDLIIPMDGKIRRIIHIVVLVAVVLWLLQAFGIWHGGLLHLAQAAISTTVT